MKSTERETTPAKIAAALMVTAAALLCLNFIQILSDPARYPLLRQPTLDRPDASNDRLEQLRVILAPLDQALPPDAPLRYLGQTEDRNQFEYLQAALAPRRIGREVDSPYLLVLAVTEEWLAGQQELTGAQLLLQLPWDIRLYRKGGAP